VSVIVFAGPSLPPGHPTAGFQMHPPARQGDVYCAAKAGPRAIAIVDGYFEAVPSVWHKEILFAMANVVHVLGAASMRALRAAELDSFGMIGIGSVYEAFRDGVLEDDDEVAVTHGPADLGYRPLTLAMVSIRATLDAVGSDALDDAESVARLRAVAKALGYWDRTTDRISREARAAGVPARDVDHLVGQLGTNLVDVKAADTAWLFQHVLEQTDSLSEPKQVRYDFNDTAAWRRFVEWAEAGA
jgi:hypothetical protein